MRNEYKSLNETMQTIILSINDKIRIIHQFVKKTIFCIFHKIYTIREFIKNFTFIFQKCNNASCHFYNDLKRIQKINTIFRKKKQVNIK